MVTWKVIVNGGGTDDEGNVKDYWVHPPDKDGTLVLQNIIEMPKKKPMSLRVAARLHGQEFWSLFHEKSRDDNALNQFINGGLVHWISEMGYHIELTGDEYEFTPEAQAS